MSSLRGSLDMSANMPLHVSGITFLPVCTFGPIPIPEDEATEPYYQHYYAFRVLDSEVVNRLDFECENSPFVVTIFKSCK
jgi:hypothetical protein